MKRQADKIRQMAQRSRLTIDAGQALIFAVNAEAGLQSVRQSRRVTQRDLVLNALKMAYPNLAEVVDNELKYPQPKVVGGEEAK